MSDFQTLEVEKRGPVEWLTLNRPERLNTLTGTMVRELVEYLQSKCSDVDTRVIVMRGAGLPVARELIYTGRFVDAARAVAIGLASASAPDDELEAQAQPLIDDLLAVSPTGLRQSKRTLDASLAIDNIETVIDLESRAQALCQDTGDFEEAMQAFLEKRPPRFATTPGRG